MHFRMEAVLFNLFVEAASIDVRAGNGNNRKTDLTGKAGGRGTWHILLLEIAFLLTTAPELLDKTF